MPTIGEKRQNPGIPDEPQIFRAPGVWDTDWDALKGGAAVVAVDPAVPDGAALILDTGTTPPTLREGAAQLTGPAVEREVFTRNRNQTIAFGDLHFMCPSSGGSSLQMRRGSNPSMSVTQFSTKWSNQQGGASEQVPNFTVTTSWRHFRAAGLNLTQHNNYQEGTFVCNGWLYNIQVIVGLSWNNNRFSCTRWRLAGIKGDPGADGANGIERVVAIKNPGFGTILGDFNFMMPGGGNRSIQIRTVSGTIAYTDFNTFWSAGAGGANDSALSGNWDETWRYAKDDLSMTAHNHYQHVEFIANGWFYHVHMVVGPGFNNNRFTLTRWKT